MKFTNALLVIMAMLAPVHAFAELEFVEEVQCEYAVNVNGPAQAIDQLMSEDKLVLNQQLRRDAKATMIQIDKLDQEIKKLRGKNGIWETADITEKRMSALTFEVLIVMDDMALLKAQFGGEFAASGRAAIRVLTSEAIIKSYKEKQTRGEISKETAEKLIADEKGELEIATQEFIDYANKTATLGFVLDIMKSSGEIIDVNTLFSGASGKRDTHGKKIVAPRDEPQLESMMSFSVRASAPQFDEPTEEESVAEIKRRATYVEEKIINDYFNTEPVQQLIAHAREIVGPSFTINAPSQEELANLKKRLTLPFTSTAEIIKRREATLKAEKNLRLKLWLMGPQLSETINNLLGSVDGKYKNALKPIARLAGLEYDSAVRRRHLAKILKVLSLKGDPAAQVTALLEGSSANPYTKKGELIVTFIRFTRAREDWNEIKEYLEKSGHSYDQKLVEEFEKYQEEAIKRGPLNLIETPSDPVGAGVAAAIGAGTVFVSGTGLSWVAEKAWFEAHSLYTTENVSALLHFVHLAGH